MIPQPDTIEALEVELERTRAKMQVLNAELIAIQQSSSWRLTAPLRAWVGAVRGWRKRRRQAALPDTVVHRQLQPLPEGWVPDLSDIKPDYAQWVQRYGSFSVNALARRIQALDERGAAPLLVVVLDCQWLMATANPTPTGLALLERFKQALDGQVFPHWRCQVLVPTTASPEWGAAIAPWHQNDARYRLVDSMADARAHCNDADGFMVIRPQDILPAWCLLTLAETLVQRPDAVLMYGDQDQLDDRGHRSMPYFKPDWSHDLYLSNAYLGRLVVFRPTYDLAPLDGFESQWCTDEQVLRCSQVVAPEHLVHIPQILCHVAERPADQQALELQHDAQAGLRARQAFLGRQGVLAEVIELPERDFGPSYRVRYQLAVPPPWVSLIVPTRNGLSVLRACMDSILSQTQYPNYDIVVVDNGSDDPDTLAYLEQIGQDPRVHITRDDGPFNYSAINNRAIEQAAGEWVVMLNNDVEVTDPDWLTEMVAQGLQPGVGAVGARLWFTDNTLQHGGVILGIHGWAAHAHNHFERQARGYFGRMALVSNFSALTGACLLVNKAKFRAVGGLNEDQLKVACNDVDLCLKLGATGDRLVWTPFANLYHHESATRGFEDTPEKKRRFQSELSYMKRRWGHYLDQDPFYNPNLTRDAQDFALAWPPARAELVRPSLAQSGLAGGSISTSASTGAMALSGASC